MCNNNIRKGQNIVNRHRPFRQSIDLRQKYLNNRYEQNQDILNFCIDEIWDEWYDYDDYEDWNYFNACEDIDFILHEARNLFLYGNDNDTLGSIFTRELRSSNKIEDEESRQINIVNEHEKLNPRGLEERLANHLHHMTESKHKNEWLPSTVYEIFKNGDDREFLQNLPVKSEEFILTLIIFSPFWVRPLRDWNPPELNSEIYITSLVNHLFVYFPIPEFLYAEWFRKPECTRLKWLCWFILIGQGGSLYRAAPNFNWKISKKFQHYLNESPNDLTPTVACIYALIRGQGGTKVEIRRIMDNPGYIIDPTKISSQEHYIIFWLDTIKWLIKYRDSITDEEAQLILNWALHHYTESERHRTKPFSWKGRKLRNTIEYSIEYDRQLIQKSPYLSLQWNSHDLDWEMIDKNTNKWSIEELTSGYDLAVEGKEMVHCVSTYAPNCASGHSAIFSLCKEGIRKVTIETNPNSNKIVQLRGRHNKYPERDEKSIIDKWVKDIVPKVEASIMS
jgi:hypothetical protein